MRCTVHYHPLHGSSRMAALFTLDVAASTADFGNCGRLSRKIPSETAPSHIRGVGLPERCRQSIVVSWASAAVSGPGIFDEGIGDA